MIDDKGKHRAGLFISPEVGACLHLCDSEGRPRIGLTAEVEARPIIVIIGPDGIVRGQFGMDDTSGFLQLSTDGDQAELNLHIHPKDGGCIDIKAPDGTPHARLQSGAGGGELLLMRKDGTAMGGFSDAGRGPMFVACDKAGDPRAMFGTSERGGFMSLSNESGTPVISLMSLGRDGAFQLGEFGKGPGIFMGSANGGPILTRCTGSGGQSIAPAMQSIGSRAQSTGSAESGTVSKG